MKESFDSVFYFAFAIGIGLIMNQGKLGRESAAVKVTYKHMKSLDTGFP